MINIALTIWVWKHALTSQFFFMNGLKHGSQCWCWGKGNVWRSPFFFFYWHNKGGNKSLNNCLGESTFCMGPSRILIIWPRFLQHKKEVLIHNKGNMFWLASVSHTQKKNWQRNSVKILFLTVFSSSLSSSFLPFHSLLIPFSLLIFI